MAGYYLVTLNADERTTLEEITRTGEAFAEIDLLMNSLLVSLR